VFSALSLSVLQRAIEWVASIAKTPQAGFLRQAKPVFKKVNIFLEKIFAGNKFDITSTEILLMAIVILLICMVFDAAEKPQMVVRAAPKPSSPAESKPKSS